MIFSELLTNLIAILLLTASFSSNASTHTNAKIDSLMTDLHKAIQNREIYLSQKENHLKELRLALYTAHDEDARFLAMGDLFDEFRPYNTDSAFAYCKQREILALKTGNKDYITNAQLNTANVFGSIGMYKEALEIVDSIQYNTVPEYLLPYYFYIKRTVASYLVDFSIRKEDKERYRKIGNIYQDSLISLCVPGSFSYVINQADKYNSNGQCEKAVAILEDYLANNEYTTHDRAICANTLAWAYQRLGNIDKQKENLLISSIADLQASVREYVSLRQLAVLLFQEGDIENAHEFLQIAMDDAQKCNARLRILEINDIFPIVISNEPPINDNNIAPCERFMLDTDEAGSFNTFCDFELVCERGQGYKTEWSIGIKIVGSQLYIIGLSFEEHSPGLDYQKRIAFEYEEGKFPLEKFRRSMLELVRQDNNPWPE